MPKEIVAENVTHTPGPWTCRVGTNGPFVNERDKTIAPFYVLNPTNIGTPAIPQDEARANARLIASAPDLLAALKELIARAVASSTVMFSSDPRVAEAVDAALAIIAKAEGRSLIAKAEGRTS
jgi:hypothetical protein